ncbi:MAG: Holliday junction branch migration DNA helicase RuvB [Holosporales bacterium]|jgi:Holliday junction DNA helicase RuvB|nr:Holliday junction branch migration DNA helicase RuvB [Holosporales bacterium]
MKERILSPCDQEADTEHIAETRPQYLRDFIGQLKLKSNLDVFIKAAKSRAQAIDHTIFYGPPGLGKTTLAQIIAREMGVGFKATSGPMIAKAGDLAALLTNLSTNDVLFIDEIHRLSPLIEEVLYPAMEDFKLDLIIGEGPAARSIRIDLPRFTLVGATTRSGLLTSPLRDRFGIQMRLDFYNHQELETIINRNASIFGVEIGHEGAWEIAERSRGTPRIACRLLRRVWDFAVVKGVGKIDKKIADQALTSLEVDNLGLDMMDRRYLKCIVEFYNGGPVGVETLCAVLSEQKDAIEEVIEPFLLQQGLVQRTSRGRVITDLGYGCLGLDKPSQPNKNCDDCSLKLF